MKYTINGYDQQKLIEINNSHQVDKLQLDCTDLVILQWVADFLVRESTKKVVFNGIQYAWVTQSLLQNDLPFIGTNKRTFTDRLDKLNNIGLIEKKVERIQCAGTFTYIKLTQLYEDLLYQNEDMVGGVPQSTGGVYSEVHGGVPQSTPKDLYTKLNNYNTDKNKKDKSFLQKAENKQYFEVLLSLGINEQVAEEFMVLRKKHSATNSTRSAELAKRGILEVSERLSITTTNVIEICLARGWYGCQTSYFDRIRLSDFGIEPKKEETQSTSKKHDTYGNPIKETIWEC